MKKLRISDNQKSKIFKCLSEIITGKSAIDYNTDFVELYNDIKFHEEKFRKFRNVGDSTFFKSWIPETGEECIMVFTILEFPLKDKDSIKLNNFIIKNIEYFEKLFITLDLVKVFRHNDYNSNNNYVFVKILKKIDINMVKSMKLETYIDEKMPDDSEELVKNERSLGYSEEYDENYIDPTNILI